MDPRARLGFRFVLGMAWRQGIVGGDPHPDNCLLCSDGRLCILDLGLLRDVERGHLEGERGIMRRIADGDAQRVHDGLSTLGYLPDSQAFDPSELLEQLATARNSMLAAGFRRLAPEDVVRIVESAYPPRSPWFALLRRERVPPPTLLLRRMELQVPLVLGQMRARANWGAIAAEHYAAEPVSTALGREDRAFFDRREALARATDAIASSKRLARSSGAPRLQAFASARRQPSLHHQPPGRPDGGRGHLRRVLL